MTMSAISHYRGGTIDEVTPVAKALKAAYLKHGVAYRLSRFETGPNAGDWFVVVQYDDSGPPEGAGSYYARPRMPTGLCRDCKVREEDQPRIGHRSRSLTQPSFFTIIWRVSGIIFSVSGVL